MQNYSFLILSISEVNDRQAECGEPITIHCLLRDPKKVIKALSRTNVRITLYTLIDYFLENQVTHLYKLTLTNTYLNFSLV